MDIKKLGPIPHGGGWRIHGRAKAQKLSKNTKPGYGYIHHALDDHSRLAYSEILEDDKKETASAFWIRTNQYFESWGINMKRVMTDNASPYRSSAFAEALGGNIKHQRTRPYRPQTNGKVERFNHTLLTEWAYAKPYKSQSQRVAAYADFLHDYNHHRGHTPLKGATPSDRVPNLCGQNTSSPSQWGRRPPQLVH